jgi:hypothetical protein
MNRDANRYPAKCYRCDKRIEAGAGWLVPGRPGEPARVTHIPCIPVARSSAA